MSATVITHQQVEETPVAAMDELLRGVPGVGLPPASSDAQPPIFNQVSMRGLGGRRALVLLDGIPIQQPLFGFVSWRRLDLEEIERVEVVRGAGASLYGGNAMGGTIQVVSRPIGQGGLRLDGSVGSRNTWRTRVSAAHRLSPRLALAAAFNAGESDGYHRIPADRRRPVDTRSSWSTSGLRLRAQWAATSALSGDVRVAHFDHELSGGTPHSGSQEEVSEVAASLQHRSFLGGDLSATLYFEDQRFGLDQVRILDGGNADRLNNIQRAPAETLGGTIAWSTEVGAELPLVTVGIEARRAVADNERVDFAPDGSIAGTRLSGGKQSSVGVFAQASWAPVERLVVLGGARLDWWRNHGGHDQIGAEPRELFDPASVTELSPRLALRYELGGGSALRGAVYRGFGPPVLRDLYRHTSFLNQELLPNPQLRPETLVGGDLGFELVVPRLRGQLNLFTNKVDDVITRVLVSDGPIRVMQERNLGAARAQGLELSGEAYLAVQWSLSASYVYADSRTIDSPGDRRLEGNRLAGVPRQSASARLTYRVAGGPMVSLRATYTGRFFVDSENLLPLGRHTVVDLFLSQPLSARLGAYAAVTNLLDERYLAERLIERRGAPRQLRIGLRWRIEPRGGET